MWLRNEGDVRPYCPSPPTKQLYVMNFRRRKGITQNHRSIWLRLPLKETFRNIYSSCGDYL